MDKQVTAKLISEAFEHIKAGLLDLGMENLVNNVVVIHRVAEGVEDTDKSGSFLKLLNSLSADQSVRVETTFGGAPRYEEHLVLTLKGPMGTLTLYSAREFVTQVSMLAP